MSKRVKLITIVFGIAILSLLAVGVVKAASFTDNQTVDANKTWTVKFTSEVGFDDLTQKGITVTDSKGNAVDVGVQLGKDSKSVIITPPQGGYTPGEGYTLNIGVNTHSKVGKSLKNQYKLDFNIKSSYIVTFKDSNLEQIIRKAINKPKGDIYKSNFESISYLNASNSHIKDISGIENLYNLQVLNLSENEISDLNLLNGLSNLRDLNLSENKISDISNLTSLSTLYSLNLNDNQIKDISVLKNLNNLQILLLNSNGISDINSLQGLVELQQLYLKNNRISNISLLKGLTSLKVLYLSQNQIQDYSPVKGYYNNLISKDFDLSDTVDTTVSFNDENLEKIIRDKINRQTGDIYRKDLEGISSLQANDKAIQDISGIENLTNLRELDLSENEISDISPLENLSGLEQLYLAKNRISDITPLGWLTNLQELYLNSNRISNITELQWLTSLKVLYLSQNHISDYTPIKEYYDNLTDKDFKISDSTIPEDIITFKDENLEKSIRNKINKPTGYIYKSDVRNIISLDVSSKNIKDISGIENLINLQTLDLSHNEISDISAINGLSDLQNLNLSYNIIIDTSILRGLNNLQTLNLSNNEISDISTIQSLNNLKSLNLSNNKISNINSLKGLTNLQTLWLNNNQVTEADKDELEDILSNCNIYYNSSF
ncbi:leucine-rich repeat domain-containing protein [Clostridiaceae bacterium UIB06]|uniref:Leucine-rich repeat domain-containing protein n=1 Tax=Clostridium thailandense TaxID=2794346 RepID=A0A949X439_9CLOT|nr:leucine-rich repeat domain-containing protein [Clostridium thailandense]MBV7275764.1 leucine-rich repeat domain-containing protein [Clostridium thailandense]MCH5136775.1 leucine-rich repeat domain-containing protein [Clostridiaceae bacterium UIB06]